jgi:hypothetical protein
MTAKYFLSFIVSSLTREKRLFVFRFFPLWCMPLSNPFPPYTCPHSKYTVSLNSSPFKPLQPFHSNQVQLFHQDSLLFLLFFSVHLTPPPTIDTCRDRIPTMPLKASLGRPAAWSFAYARGGDRNIDEQAGIGPGPGFV